MPNSPDQSPEPYWPFDRDHDGDGAHPGPPDATRINGPIDGPINGPADATQIHGPADATQVGGAASPARPDQTSVQPPVEAAPRWSARANVPQPGDPALRQSAPQVWVEEEDPYHGRSWFTPVIVSVVALVLIGALSVGVWLIYRATQNGQNAPVAEAPVPSVAVSVVPTPSLAPTTEAAPSSEAPPTTSAAPSTGPVVIPPLHGDTLAEATVKLQVLGLNVKVQRKQDGSLPVGEVLSSDPAEGATAAPGDTVTLVVATAPSPSPSPSRSRPSASASS